MIHRLALFVGGAGAAGVLALALTLNGSAPPTSTDAFVPVANDVTAGDQLALAPPTVPPVQVTDPGADQTAPSVKKQVDTIYVLSAPHKGDQPSDTPRPPRSDGGGNVAGDDGQGDESGDSSDDQTGGQDVHAGGDQSDDGGSNGGGQEPGDD
ncbi:MAG: hypothetical protein QFC55_05180 [Chloroflexota bacterium]|nr:hypothetical protein [Chloroflexota bacterium]